MRGPNSINLLPPFWVENHLMTSSALGGQDEHVRLLLIKTQPCSFTFLWWYLFRILDQPEALAGIVSSRQARVEHKSCRQSRLGPAGAYGGRVRCCPNDQGVSS